MRARSERARPLPSGARVERYTILELVGRGGMGTVYAAYDPKLDRRVALKIVGAADERDGAARDRLVREARALARLSHPNIVGVFDVGFHEDQVFVAMELVDGVDLRAWLATPRAVSEVVEVFLSAGRGLAAAHRAGLVHRDFKLDNVVIGADGRVRVLDFGLARAVAGPAGRSDTPLPVDDSSSMQSMDITGAGRVAGTPGYMAPELYLGREADAASDQFSFCVSLYRALYGQRPFAGKSAEEQVKAITAGQLRPPPADKRVPRRVTRVVLRGLGHDAAERFGSMDALLRELAGATRRRRYWIVAAGAVLVAGAAGAGALFAGDARPACAGAGKQADAVWTATARDEVRRALLSSGRPHAGETGTRVVALLDRRFDDWRTMRHEACVATRVRGEQSEQVLDLRASCLDRRLAETRALVDLFRRDASPEVADRAIQAVVALPGLGVCAHPDTLRSVAPPPDDPEVAARVDEVQARIDEVVAQVSAGQYQLAEDNGRAALDEASAVGHAPAIARAAHHFAWATARNGKPAEAIARMEEAIGAASSARDDYLLARSIAILYYIRGVQQRRHDEALAMTPLVYGMVERVGPADPTAQPDIMTTHAFLLSHTGALAEADALLARAAERWIDAVGRAHPDVAHTLNQRALLAARRGDFDEARRWLDEALATWREAFGPRHPMVATALNNLGSALIQSGRGAEAAPYFEQALAIWRDGLGADHLKVGIATNNLAEVAADAGDCERAVPRFREALRIFESQLAPDHPYIGPASSGLGRCALGRGDYASASVLLERSLALRDRNTSPVAYADTAFALARALWAQPSQRRRARALAAQARDLYADHGEVAASRLAAVEAWLARPSP